MASLNVDTRSVVDLTNCDREAIHIPGSVQAHGFLLAVDDDGFVAMASQNSGRFLGRPVNAVLGASLVDLLPEQGKSLLKSIASEQLNTTARFLCAIPNPSNHEHLLEITVHRSGGLAILEFEESGQRIDVDELSGKLYRMIADVELLHTPDALSAAAVDNLRLLTGFDRVLLYNFDDDGNGIVLAESRNERLPSYQDLRFPASDIPSQARRLYEANRIRIIPDVDYQPSPIVGTGASFNPANLDLSGSILRSVSPVHREYMRNMGTAASMSLSILMDGRLWGLISFHHKDPHYVPFRLRSYCEVLTRVYAAQMGGLLKHAVLTRAIELKRIQSTLLTHLASEQNHLDSLAHRSGTLMEMMEAGGAALVITERCMLFGQTPAEEQVLGFASWLNSLENRDLFVTAAASRDFPPAIDWADSGSGVLAISLSRIHRFYLIWFRPELVSTVKWAGEPVKEEQRIAGRLDLHPRHSFDTWSETVRNCARPWTQVEIEACTELRGALLEIVLKRAEEIADLVSELEFANKELEAFSYSVSHDLRAPFRHISGFAELLLDEPDSKLGERGARYTRTIIESARFAGVLVDTLLNFSRIARSPIHTVPLDVNSIISEEWQELYALEANGRSIDFQVDVMPPTSGDAVLIRQVFRNLLSNAIKYSRDVPETRIHAGHLSDLKEDIFFVSDNGAGFDQTYAHKLFGVFQRLHRAEEFEGTGIGLANVRRIITRHGGRTWAEGKPHEGATFFFSLPRKERFAEKDA